MQIDFSPKKEAVLQAKAAARQISVPELVRQLALEAEGSANKIAPEPAPAGDAAPPARPSAEAERCKVTN